MKDRKKKALIAKGYVIGSADDFLGLTKEESAYVEMKLALAKEVAKKRKKRKMTQVQVAKLTHSSQSRIAKMERGDPSVSLDLLIKTLLALGTQRKTLAKVMAT
jgi:predicted XRE-type DNA-binding protein